MTGVSRALAFVAGFAAGTAALSLFAQTASNPNILFIAVDDLNDWGGPLAGAADVLGGEQALMDKVAPNLTRLAGLGVTFANAQTGHPACNPSRAALMSGVSGATSGLTNNQGGNNWRNWGGNRWLTSLPQHLKNEAGYNLQTTGKIWHTSGQNDSPTATAGSTPPASQRAVTNWDATPNNGNANQPSFRGTTIEVGGIKWQKQIPQTSGRDDFSEEASQALADAQADHQKASWAADIVTNDAAGGTPKFIATGIFRPHMPWNVPVHYFDRFPIESINIPNIKADDLDDMIGDAATHGLKNDHDDMLANPLGTPDPLFTWKSAIQAYLASTAYADDAIGKMVDAVEAKNSDADPDNDWTVVLWSDHGWSLGEKENWRKFNNFDEGARSNLMVWAPGVTDDQAGAMIDVPVDFVDVAPTVSELAGVGQLRQFQGQSAVDLLADKDARADNVAVTIANDTEYGLRSKRYRYMRHGDGSEQLYDHHNDPDEFYNLTNLAYGENAMKATEFGHTPESLDEKIKAFRTELFAWLVRRASLEAKPGGGVSLESIDTLGAKQIARFNGSGDLSGVGWTLQDGGGGANDVDLTLAGGKAVLPTGVRVQSTIDGIALATHEDFLAAVDVELQGDAAGLGIVFGFESTASYYELQLINEASSKVSGGEQDLRLIRVDNGATDTLLSVDDIKQLDNPGGAALDFSNGFYTLIADYDAASQQLELIVQNGEGVNHYRGVVQLDASLADGSLFGVTSWAARNQTAVDNFIVLTTPSAAAGLAGDYNGDGVVDTGDYAAWRESLGQNVAPGEGADGDGDGVIGQGDFDVWKANYGASVHPDASQSSAAPEPAAAALCLAFASYARLLRGA